MYSDKVLILNAATSTLSGQSPIPFQSGSQDLSYVMAQLSSAEVCSGGPVWVWGGGWNAGAGRHTAVKGPRCCYDNL